MSSDAHHSTVNLKTQNVDMASLIAASVRRPDWVDDLHFMRIPRNAPADAPTWRIILKPVEGENRMLPLELAGDTVLGVAGGDIVPDVDLCIWDAAEMGVSRKHVRLRPRPGKLFVMDMGTKNGTFINGLPISPSQTAALTHKDYLSLGKLHLQVFIVEKPS